MVVRSENTRPNAWYSLTFGNRYRTYIKNAQRAVTQNVKLPIGYTVVWSGEFEYMERMQKE